jgi:hypothetical protein
MVLAAGGHALSSWPEARSFADSNNERWTPDYISACRYIDRNAGPEDVVLHNICYRSHKSLLGFCARRFFASDTEHGGIFEDFTLNDRSWAEARAFFSGGMHHPLNWFRARGIRYVYWDLAGPQFRFAEVAAQNPFLRPVLRDGSVTVYRVEDTEAVASAP